MDAQAQGSRQASTPAQLAREISGTTDLLEPLRQGAIDVSGPVVDFGEPQAAPFLLPPLPLHSEEVNGDSWASVGSRVRIRVLVDQTRLPDRIRLRVRRVHARRLLAIVNGVPVRQIVLEPSRTPTVLTLPVVPERFARNETTVELRFLGVVRPPVERRPARRTVMPPAVAAGTDLAVTLGTQVPAPTVPPVAEIDWVHLTREAGVVTRCSDLVADVRVGASPRRALTLFAPTRLSWVTVLTGQSTLRTAAAAEGVHGSQQHSIRGRIRIEADDVPSLEDVFSVDPGSSWSERSLSLSAFAGRAVRISFAAEALDLEGQPLPPPPTVPPPAPSARDRVVTAANAPAPARDDTRLAFSDPRLVTRPAPSFAPPPPSRHALLVVVRGLRADRLLPAVSSRLNSGFARMAREGLVARALSPSMDELSALASLVTGLRPETHRVVEWTDTHDERAPTLGSLLREGGVATGLFTDDQWLVGSGLDRGYSEVHGCPNELATCSTESVMMAAADWLASHRDRRAFALVVTRAGLVPLDPPREVMTELDPTPAENAMSPEQTMFLAARSASASLTIEPAARERLALLYDGALMGVDRALGHALERLRDRQTLDQTAVVLVGSRATVLGEGGRVGDAPTPMSPLVETVVMVHSAGVRARVLPETVSALDATATVLERMGVQGRWESAEAPVSLAALPGAGAHPHGFIASVGPHGLPALHVAALRIFATRTGAVQIFDTLTDPLVEHDLASERPIARAFAERAMAADRESSQVPTMTYTPSTRVLADPIARALRLGRHLHR